jgi:hypothetical protein
MLSLLVAELCRRVYFSEIDTTYVQCSESFGQFTMTITLDEKRRIIFAFPAHTHVIMQCIYSNSDGFVRIDGNTGLFYSECNGIVSQEIMALISSMVIWAEECSKNTRHPLWMPVGFTTQGFQYRYC